MRTVNIRTPDRELEAEVADSFLSLSIGMRFRSEGEMLFVFDRSRPMIDMMFVPVPLQLVFIDSDKQVVDVQEAEPWSMDPRTWKVYRPEKECSYLLESTQDLDIEEGDSLEFEI